MGNDNRLLGIGVKKIAFINKHENITIHKTKTDNSDNKNTNKFIIMCNYYRCKAMAEIFRGKKRKHYRNKKKLLKNILIKIK